MKLLISLTFAACLAAVYGQRCKYEDDCDDGFCCAALSTPQLTTWGICLKLAARGAKCSDPKSKLDYYGGKYLYVCPCRTGLACNPVGLREEETEYDQIMAKLKCVTDKATTAAEPPTGVSGPEKLNIQTEPQPDLGGDDETPKEFP